MSASPRMSRPFNSTNFRDYGSLDPSNSHSDNENMTNMSSQERSLSLVSSHQYRKSSLHVAENIHTIQKMCLELLDLSKQLGLASEVASSELAAKLNTCMASVKFLISDTTADIHGLVRLAPSLSPAQKIQIKRLKSDFEAAVQSYGSLQKTVVSRTSRPRRRNPFDEYERSTSDRQLLLEEEEERKHKQTQMLSQVQAETEILINRQEIVQDLERNVVDINDIMKQLATMVSEQGEAVNSIENNVESAAVYVTDGAQELQKASTYQTRRRRCTFFLLILAFSALVVLGIVLYIELKQKN